MEINLLVKSLFNQMPTTVKPELEDKVTHFVLKIIEPDAKFNNHFKKYYREPSIHEIDIYNHEYQKLIDLSITLKRFYAN